MTPSRITATLAALIATALTVQAQWKYRTTESDEYRVGTNGRKVRIEASSATVTIALPNGWHLLGVTSDETGCKLTIGSSPKDSSFTFSMHRKWPPGVIDLDFFEHRSMPTWSARDEDAFWLPDGRRLIPHHKVGEFRQGERYTSMPLDSAVLYLYTHDGEYNCTFAFTGSRLLGLPPSRHDIQEILDTCVFTHRNRSDRALNM
ncbi:MAG TPA: hypothetical protein VH170_05505 [Chthoniobacterales bacterium]|jgi:hypothetical protein|nr:hypothetical protein [Chthoniobacterales bacterium]